MTLQSLAAALAVVALSGCTSASLRWSSRSAAAADPERWDRTMCRLGMYPAEIDSRALARARYDDLLARRSRSTIQFAALGILSEREAFEARCAVWRAASEGTALYGATAPTD